MAASLISEWKMLRRGRPGHRFQDRYESSRRTKNRRSMVGRIIRLVLALAALAIGVVLMFIPGPAIVFFFLAGSLLAAESRAVARLLDWSEVKLRKVASWLRAKWRKLPVFGKIVTGIGLLAIGAVGLFIGYRISFG
jgi:hypothetical protein